jgi:hypothetical protein
MEGTIAVFIPIIMTLVTGIILVTWLYFRSKEKQMMIDKGMSYEQMMEFFKSRRSPYLLLKWGIVIFFFGLGLGLGMVFTEASGNNQEFWIPLLLFTGTGLGMAVAFYSAKKLEEKKESRQ